MTGKLARIAIFDGPGHPFRFEDRPLPEELGPGEALVKVLLATICGFDLHTVDGRRREPTPSVLGHEAVSSLRASAARRPFLAGGPMEPSRQLRRVWPLSSVGFAPRMPATLQLRSPF